MEALLQEFRGRPQYKDPYIEADNPGLYHAMIFELSKHNMKTLYTY